MPVEHATRYLLALAFWLPWLVCTWLALTPSPPSLVGGLDDIVQHALAFVYLTFALVLAHLPDKRLAPALWMLAYGVLIELLQSLIPEREPDFGDLLVDGVGIVVGLVLATVLAERLRQGCAALIGRLMNAEQR